MSLAGHSSSITRHGLADEIDGLDLQIKALNEQKSAAYKAYREQLEYRGMEPRRASAEVAATKAAIAKRRKLRENPDAAREKDDLIDAIMVEIMDRPSRAREEADPKLIETIVQGVQTDIGRTILTAALDVMIEREEFVPHSKPAAISSDEIASTNSGSQRSGVSNPPEATLGASPAESDSEEISAPIPDEDEGIPAFLRKRAEPELNERCERPKNCKFSHHPQKVTCSTCSTAWAIAQRKKAQVAA